jgi:hypothetical protein
VFPSAAQVEQIAPDSGSLNRARKTARPAKWADLGHGDAALWGRCKGSGKSAYDVRVDLTDYGAKCSCPSRKFPCKHALALLLLAADEPGAFTAGTPPDWASDWLTQRRQKAEAKTVDRDAGLSDAERDKKEAARRKTRARTAAKREAAVSDGIAGLDLWLRDIVRNGIADLDARADSFWTNRARALVDAKAPGLGRRVGWLAGIPGSKTDWPEHLLGRLGQLALLADAWTREADLPPSLRADLRAAIGFSLKKEEVAATGEAVQDRWLVAGQLLEEGDDGLWSQRTWLLGQASGRAGLVRRYARGPVGFGPAIVPGTILPATLRYWPSAAPLRVLIAERSEQVEWDSPRLPGHDSVDGFLAEVAETTAALPWVGLLPCALRDVIPLRTADGAWWVRDAAGHGLRLSRGAPWSLLAVSGGAPLDVFGEWNGAHLRPLGLVSDGVHLRLDVQAA